MDNGAPATRAIARLVLLDGRFSHLPVAVSEGRRVTANIERAASLFRIKKALSPITAVGRVRGRPGPGRRTAN